jgi:hypothetical protein
MTSKEPDTDDAIVARWIGGQGAHGISRSLKVPPGHIREVLGRYAAETVPLDRCGGSIWTTAAFGWLMPKMRFCAPIISSRRPAP